MVKAQKCKWKDEITTNLQIEESLRNNWILLFNPVKAEQAFGPAVEIPVGKPAHHIYHVGVGTVVLLLTAAP